MCRRAQNSPISCESSISPTTRNDRQRHRQHDGRSCLHAGAHGTRGRGRFVRRRLRAALAPSRHHAYFAAAVAAAVARAVDDRGLQSSHRSFRSRHRARAHDDRRAHLAFRQHAPALRARDHGASRTAEERVARARGRSHGRRERRGLALALEARGIGPERMSVVLNGAVGAPRLVTAGPPRSRCG